ncbi:MAG: ATP-binding protein [Reinekea sp.]|jgi:signal transduction histidine kinase
MSYLQQLNLAFDKLAKAKNVDDLAKRAVIALREQLHFDRAGILWYDAENSTQVGTWGTDEQGRLREEHDLCLPVSDDLLIKPGKERFRFKQNHDFYGVLDKPIPEGWVFQAPISSEQELYGWLFVDNLIHLKPLTDAQSEIIQAFANALGQLIVRCKIEDSLIEAVDSLVTNENITTSALERVNELEAQLDGSRKLVQLAERLSGLIPVSARAVGNLLNFVTLLQPEQFNVADRALLASAKKSADQLSRIFKFADAKVHEATDNDVQTMPASLVRDYWYNYFHSLFRATSHTLEVRSEDPTISVSVPLILLTQLVKELVFNALQHGLEGMQGGYTRVSLSMCNGTLTVHVEDSGSGLDEEQYMEVQKMFVTSKPNEQLGTGLNVTLHYVERWLNGQLELGPSELGGLRCTLKIPVSK